MDIEQWISSSGATGTAVYSSTPIKGGDVKVTVAATDQAAVLLLQPQGSADEQSIALRDAMRVLFPEAVALVSAARQGFMREHG